MKENICTFMYLCELKDKGLKIIISLFRGILTFFLIEKIMYDPLEAIIYIFLII